MSQLKCKVCAYPLAVSEEDPDSTVDEMIKHIERHQKRAMPLTFIELVEDRSDSAEPEVPC